MCVYDSGFCTAAASPSNFTASVTPIKRKGGGSTSPARKVGREKSHPSGLFNDEEEEGESSSDEARIRKRVAGSLTEETSHSGSYSKFNIGSEVQVLLI